MSKTFSITFPGRYFNKKDRKEQFKNTPSVAKYLEIRKDIKEEKEKQRLKQLRTNLDTLDKY